VIAVWVLLSVLPAAGYLAMARRLRVRGDAWPWWRDLAFAAGVCAIPAVMPAPLPYGDFTGHMVQHLVIAMIAPLLLVAGRPVTLTLRALPPSGVRRTLLSALHSRPLRVLLFPPVAALLDVGGLFALYCTPLFAESETHPWLHAVIHLHLVAAGTLFTAADCQLDPVRHRWGRPTRSAVLVAASAAHGVLAKILWTTPPPGTAVPAGDLHAAAELMYYGGDAVEIALALIIALQWYARAGRRGVSPSIERAGRASS
jgi:putative membrane protein